VQPDFTDIEIGISRTQPHYDGQEEVREVERLFFDAIDAAERCIYIENQFITCVPVAERLARKLRQTPNLEAIIVAPQTQQSWLEAQTMRNARIRFMRILQDEGIAPRVRIVYPEISEGGQSVDTMIHSKVMVVDDRLLRIGSANLNNRSMGTDTECDLVLEAERAAERGRVTEIRNRLFGEHCGADAETVAKMLERTGSMVKVVDKLSRRGHRLRPINDGEPDLVDLSPYIEGVADPERPIDPEAFVNSMVGGRVPRRHLSSIARIGIGGLLVLLLALVWQYTPLARFAEPELVRDTLASFAQGSWAPFVVVAVFVVAGLVVFPLTILIVATAATFGPVLGFVYAAAGALASALVTYALGAKLGKESLRNFLGPRLNRVREKIAKRGVIAVAAIRVVPIAPFTVVNLAAGASEIRLLDYILGTMLGLAPGLVLLSAVGHQVFQIILNPTFLDVALLGGAIIAWIALSIGVQILVSKRWANKS
jgi:uncharacterized membrane protein YdjX (TVP38/TMEM64 family)